VSVADGDAGVRYASCRTRALALAPGGPGPCCSVCTAGASVSVSVRGGLTTACCCNALPHCGGPTLMEGRVASLRFRTTLAATPYFGLSSGNARSIHRPLTSRHGSQTMAMAVGIGSRHRSRMKRSDAHPDHVRSRVPAACVCGGHRDQICLQLVRRCAPFFSIFCTYWYPAVAAHAAAAQRAAAAG
jgi:hypothetical protein